MISIRTAVLALTPLASGVATAQTAAPQPAPMMAAPAPAPKSFWVTGFNQGISEYSTGTFDQPVDGGIRIACMPGGAATLTVQIKGMAPAAGSRFMVIPATRQGKSQTFTFTAGPNGDVRFARARSDRQFGRMWAAFRGGNNATIRFADGGFSVQSLIGATSTLPARPCG